MVGLTLAFTNLLCGTVFLVLALVFRFKKDAAYLIAGYNTSSKEEQAKWDEKEMCRYFSTMFFVLTALMLVTGIAILLISSISAVVWILLVASWSIFVAILIFTLIYLNRSKRFRI